MIFRVICVLLVVVLCAPVLAQDDVTIHVVQRGENLFRIAMQYGLTIDELAQLNGIVDPSSILVGQRLLVPASAAAVSPPQQHTVRAGETLRSIAQLYSVDVNLLATQNDITNVDTIYVGQVLTIVPEALVQSVEAVLPTTAPALDAPALEPSEVVPTVEPETEPVEEVAAGDLGIQSTPIQMLVHVVAPGETLFSIAEPYGLTVNELARANSIIDPTLLFVGQELVIPGFTPIETAFDLPAPMLSLEIEPLVLVEGKTGRFRVMTSAPATVSVNFMGRVSPMAADEAGTMYTLLVGVEIFSEPGVYPLSLTVTDSAGTTTQFDTNVQVVAGGYGREFITLPEDRVGLLAPEIEDAELNIIRSLMTYEPTRYFDGPLGLPVAAPMNDPFGRARSYNGGDYDRYHTGADFAAAPGAPILAAGPGQVVMADNLNIRGTTTIINHGWGVYTVYCHQSQTNVQVGQWVTTGQVIGASGSSGRATGAHLHWEVWVNGTPVDPLQWVQQSFV